MSAFGSPFVGQLCTNYVPSALDREHIRGLLVEPTHRLERMNSKIADIEATLYQLVKERDVLEREIEEHNCLLSPFRRLPDDILREIFLACLPDTHNATMSSREAPLLLGRICGRWRAIVYATPRLWATLHIPLPQPLRRSTSSSDGSRMVAYNERLAIHLAAIKAWIARSGMCGLSLSFHPSSGLTPEHDLVVQDYLKTLLLYSKRWYSIEITIPYGHLSDVLLDMDSASLPMLRHLIMKFPHSVPHDKANQWARCALITAPQLRSADLLMFPTSPTPVAASWRCITHLSLSDVHTFSPTNRRGLTIHEAHEILSACTLLEHCDLDISDNPESTSPVGPISLPHLRSLAIVEVCVQLGTLFEAMHDLPALCAVSYHTGLWPSYTRPSALISLLARTGGRLKYLSTNLRYYTLPDLRAVFAALPELTHLADEGCRISNTREQVIGRTQRLPPSFNVKKVILAMLSPPVPLPEGQAECTLLPRLRNLTIKESADLSEKDMLTFVTARMEAGAVPGAPTELLRELRISFTRSAKVDLRIALFCYTEEAGGPLRLNITYRSRHVTSEKEFHTHRGLMKRRVSPLIAAAYSS